MRRNRRPDWRRIRTLRSYTVEELAKALGVHRNTVRHWINDQELPAFTDQRPHLVQGTDAVGFLRQRQAARRQKCGPGQFYCVKCRDVRDPAEGMVDYQPLTGDRGILLALCPICEGLMRRFSSRPNSAQVSEEAPNHARPTTLNRYPPAPSEM